MPPALTPKRTASEVIQGAIRENKGGERLLYFFALATFMAGMAALGVGLYRSDGLSAVAGTATGAMFYPAMRSARKVREQNMAIMAAGDPAEQLQDR